MANWMVRTWWVQLAAGVFVSAGLVQRLLVHSDEHWLNGAVPAVLSAWMFFGAGALWEQRKARRATDERAPSSAVASS